MMMWLIVIISDVRAAYDTQIRRLTTPDEPGARVETVTSGAGSSGIGPSGAGTITRSLAPAGQGPSRVSWSDLDEASADGAIAAQVDFFRRRGEAFEWKLHDDDQPADLGARLAAAGLSPGPEELVMVADAAEVAAAQAPRACRTG